MTKFAFPPYGGNGTFTTVAIGGATIGTNALAVSGTSSLSGNIIAGSLVQFGGTTSSFPAMGASGTSLVSQLADGSDNASIQGAGVIVQGGGNAAAALQRGLGLRLGNSLPVQWSSTTAYNGTGDLFLTRSGAATLQLGAANSATPVAQTLQAQGSRSGTDTNVSGGNLTFASGNGTGNSTPSSLIFQTPVAVASGTGAQTQTTGLTIKGGQAVLTAYTVTTLPTGITGGEAYVTDALAPAIGVTVASGGAAKAKVWYNGAAWTVTGI